MAKLLQHIPKVEARAAITALVLGVALTGTKFVAYYLTGSAAIFADALENIVNVIAACVSIYALFVAHRPADEDHPYGHGKIEFLSAATEGGMVLLAALVIAGKAMANLFVHHTEPSNLHSGIMLIAIAMVANGLTGGYLIGIGRRHSSATLVADGKHLLSDSITSAAALAALVAVHLTGKAFLDPLAAMAVALYVAWMGLHMIKDASAALMDKQDVGDDKLLRALLDAHLGPNGKPPRICSYHKLRHRHSGRYHWVDFHIVLPAHVDVERAHNIASAIEYELEQNVGEGNATAHVEPCVNEGCATCAVVPEDAPPPPPSFQKGS